MTQPFVNYGPLPSLPLSEGAYGAGPATALLREAARQWDLWNGIPTQPVTPEPVEDPNAPTPIEPLPQDDGSFHADPVPQSPAPASTQLSPAGQRYVDRVTPADLQAWNDFLGSDLDKVQAAKLNFTLEAAAVTSGFTGFLAGATVATILVWAFSRK